MANNNTPNLEDAAPELMQKLNPVSQAMSMFQKYYYAGMSMSAVWKMIEQYKNRLTEPQVEKISNAMLKTLNLVDNDAKFTKDIINLESLTLKQNQLALNEGEQNLFENLKGLAKLDPTQQAKLLELQKKDKLKDTEQTRLKELEGLAKDENGNININNLSPDQQAKYIEFQNRNKEWGLLEGQKQSIIHTYSDPANSYHEKFKIAQKEVSESADKAIKQGQEGIAQRIKQLDGQFGIVDAEQKKQASMKELVEKLSKSKEERQKWIAEVKTKGNKLPGLGEELEGHMGDLRSMLKERGVELDPEEDKALKELEDALNPKNKNKKIDYTRGNGSSNPEIVDHQDGTSHLQQEGLDNEAVTTTVPKNPGAETPLVGTHDIKISLRYKDKKTVSAEDLATERRSFRDAIKAIKKDKIGDTTLDAISAKYEQVQLGSIDALKIRELKTQDINVIKDLQNLKKDQIIINNLKKGFNGPDPESFRAALGSGGLIERLKTLDQNENELIALLKGAKISDKSIKDLGITKTVHALTQIPKDISIIA